MQKTTPCTKRPCYLIAEMACSHEGDIHLAKKIIEASGQAGADAIQFQIFQPEKREVPYYPGFAKIKSVELTREVWRELVGFSRKRFPKMEIIGCVYDVETIGFTETLSLDRYKIHAADLENPEVITCVAETGKPIDLSIGAATLAEISKAIGSIRETSASEIALMYGVQNFPTRVETIDLRYMMILKESFGFPIGYQDHCEGESLDAFTLPIAALALGVDILEKHITHDRSFKGVDHEAALNPEEFTRFVQAVRHAEAAMGTGLLRDFNDEELRYRRYARKSTVTSRPISRGEKIQETDFVFLRAPDLGIPPDQAEKLIGKTAVRELAQFEVILEKDLF